MSKDLFSKQANTYSRYRPSYPAELVDYVLSFVENKFTAWDCATGNGQAATLLARHFEKVFATDISSKQLEFAKAKDNIEYLVCPAEQTPFAENTFDLITIAQAYHWFNFEDFHREANRVGRPGAVIAAWGYSGIITYDTAVDSIVGRFYTDIVGPYWDVERKFVEENYQTVPFNFSPLPVRDFSFHAQWLRDDLIGYLNSWSAVRHFIADKQYDPLSLITEELCTHWKKDAVKEVTFPLFLRLGRVEGSGL